ncbi:DeoR/GlpR family DNA-binding transcription regulator [Sphingobacterium sp. Mn56C]|uniref:DeoR/GlpR family DNA-binding transcription regulator n=1 Tax=Sphingobacterium sp. Mn56C TaxID=3395261 RepID=UPI003BEC548B
MLKEERFEFILEQLKKESSVSYETFAASLSVSEDTIRRDIEQLYRNGLVSKVRGGAMLRSKDPLSFQDRTLTYHEEKNAIALKAQRFIRPGMTIFMDGGTTVCALASTLQADIAVRIITNNVALMPILTAFKHIDIIFLGGEYQANTATTCGLETTAEVLKYNADLYFMGTCALDDKNGISAVFKNDAAVKRAMLSASQKTVVLADSNKLNQTEPFKVTDIHNIDYLVSELAATDPSLDAYRSLGVSIL